MRWMKFRKPPEKPATQPPGDRKAEEALGDAIVQKADADSRADAVDRLARSLAAIRERNHFSESLEALFGGGR